MTILPTTMPVRRKSDGHLMRINIDAFGKWKEFKTEDYEPLEQGWESRPAFVHVNKAGVVMEPARPVRVMKGDTLDGLEAQMRARILAEKAGRLVESYARVAAASTKRKPQPRSRVSRWGFVGPKRYTPGRSRQLPAVIVRAKPPAAWATPTRVGVALTACSALALLGTAAYLVL